MRIILDLNNRDEDEQLRLAIQTYDAYKSGTIGKRCGWRTEQGEYSVQINEHSIRVWSNESK